MAGSLLPTRLALAAAVVAVTATTAAVSQATGAGVQFTFQGKSAAGSDGWPTTRGRVSAFGDGGGFHSGRVSIGIADIVARRNLVGPGATNACYAPLPGFPTQKSCLDAKALGIRFEGSKLCLALQPGSGTQNLRFSQIACAPSVTSDLGGKMGPRITGVLPPTFIEGDPDFLMAVSKRGNSLNASPCDVILMQTAGGATGPVRYWDGSGFGPSRAAAEPVFTTASCGRAPGVIKVGSTYRLVIAKGDRSGGGDALIVAEAARPQGPWTVRGEGQAPGGRYFACFHVEASAKGGTLACSGTGGSDALNKVGYTLN
jgi:hypothetical protein